MKYISENISAFDLSSAHIEGGSFEDGRLILTLSGGVSLIGSDNNSFGEDMHIPEMIIEISGVEIITASYIKRNYLNIQNSSVRTAKERALYKSEQALLCSRISAGDADIFSFENDSDSIAAEILFYDAAPEESYISAKIKYTGLSISWDAFGEPRKRPKLTLKDRAKMLKRDIPAVFLALGHKETPMLAKLTAGIAVGYALSPVDLIPDFIPVLGYLDDVLLLPFLVMIAVKLIPTDVMEQCRKDAEGLWDKGKPKKWFYALPVVFIWVIVMILIINIFIK